MQMSYLICAFNDDTPHGLCICLPLPTYQVSCKSIIAFYIRCNFFTYTHKTAWQQKSKWFFQHSWWPTKKQTNKEENKQVDYLEQQPLVFTWIKTMNWLGWSYNGHKHTDRDTGQSQTDNEITQADIQVRGGGHSHWKVVWDAWHPQDPLFQAKF